MTLTQAAPLAPDFPVDLQDVDAQHFWQQDRMHFPGQVLPLDGELMASAPGRGMTHAFRVYEAPIEAMRVRIEHGYVYNAMVGVQASPAELEELGRRSEEAVMGALGRLGERWDTEWLPAIRRHLQVMGALDLPRASGAALAAHLDEVVARYDRLWQLHMIAVLPSYLAMSEFEDFYRDVVGGQALDAYRLLQGIPSKTTEVAADLWRLSRVALGSAEVTSVLSTAASGDVPALLERSPEGRAFRVRLDEHLRRYGHRSATWGLGSPSFIEDPAPVIKVLADYVGQPDAADPAEDLARLAADREQAVADARERLRPYPAAVRAQFDALLAAAQAGAVISEDHNFWIDFYATDLVRQVVLELGRRCADARTLSHPHDVLYLTLDELRAAAPAPAAADLRAVVVRRRADLQAYAAVPAPPVLGTPPAGPPPDSPFTRLTAKFWGTSPQAPTEPGVLRGAGGSRGALTGPARVVRALADTERLRPGEILVAETTAPPWTPLFAIAAAVVTDTGGILSHSAVVAREYAIPAVVGTGLATATIRDGDLLEVDGDTGIVRIVG